MADACLTCACPARRSRDGKPPYLGIDDDSRRCCHARAVRMREHARATRNGPQDGSSSNSRSSDTQSPSNRQRQPPPTRSPPQPGRSLQILGHSHDTLLRSKALTTRPVRLSLARRGSAVAKAGRCCAFSPSRRRLSRRPDRDSVASGSLRNDGDDLSRQGDRVDVVDHRDGSRRTVRQHNGDGRAAVRDQSLDRPAVRTTGGADHAAGERRGNRNIASSASAASGYLRHRDATCSGDHP